MNLLLFAPELFLLLGCLLAFLLTLSDKDGELSRLAAIGTAVGSVVLCLSCFSQSGYLFYGAYHVDLFSQLFKLMIMVGLTIVLCIGQDLKGIERKVRAEYYLFLLIGCLGLMMLVSSVELISLFVALELSSFCLYILVPMRSDQAGLRCQMESAVKYLFYGVVATGIMLFGMSYLFGLTGTTYLSELLPKLQAIGATPVVVVAVTMVMCGFFFKLAVFPFHFWVPDVYQGASNETTAFIASVPKLAGVAMLIRITTLAAPGGEAIVTMLSIAALCSMFYGNLSALVQKDIKRMLGFSGIAHAGFVLLGLLTLTESGYATAMYYIFGYLVMNLACFVVICTVSKEGENLLISDLSGLHKRAPLLALTLAVGMFALAGIPPLVGFMGEFMLLTGAWAVGQRLVVILGAINSAIAIYYYLSVVRVAYCSSPEVQDDVPVSLLTKMVSLVLIIAIIGMGVMPAPILAIAATAVQGIL